MAAASSFGTPIAPSRDDNPGTRNVSTDNDDSCDVALLPETVRFDESENAVGEVPVSRVCTPIQTVFAKLIWSDLVNERSRSFGRGEAATMIILISAGRAA